MKLFLYGVFYLITIFLFGVVGSFIMMFNAESHNSDIGSILIMVVSSVLYCIIAIPIFGLIYFYLEKTFNFKIKMIYLMIFAILMFSIPHFFIFMKSEFINIIFAISYFLSPNIFFISLVKSIDK